jgi:thiol-disulfide isomerase/thioredoxin
MILCRLFVISLVFFNVNARKISEVIELNESNWDLMLEDGSEWMVEFFAPWCPACKSLEPVWTEYGTWADDLSIKVGKVDVVSSPGLSGRFFVTALPTIFHVINGEFRQYKGSRDLNSFMTFVEEKKWQGLEKISSWKKPDSVPMSILSWFFRLSHFLKELNNTLLKEYGLPVWASYAIFAVATILIGAIVGLILVCIIDCIWPQKHGQRQTFSERKEKEKFNDGEEIKGDDLEDEEDSETSESEKNSGSESEEIESDKGKESPKATPTSSPDVRKRRTRKAD